MSNGWIQCMWLLNSIRNGVRLVFGYNPDRFCDEFCEMSRMNGAFQNKVFVKIVIFGAAIYSTSNTFLGKTNIFFLGKSNIGTINDEAAFFILRTVIFCFWDKYLHWILKCWDTCLITTVNTFVYYLQVLVEKKTSILLWSSLKYEVFHRYSTIHKLYRLVQRLRRPYNLLRFSGTIYFLLKIQWQWRSISINYPQRCR